MHTCVENLESILDAKTITKIKEGEVKLVERTNPQETYTIELKGLPEDSLVIKIDKFKAQSGFLKSENGICKRADYVIFENNNIVFIEMKRTIQPENDKSLTWQLQGAQCVIAYCASIGRYYKNNEYFLGKEKSEHFVCLCYYNPSIYKNWGKRKTERKSTPENPNIIKCTKKEKLHYNCLLRKPN